MYVAIKYSPKLKGEARRWGSDYAGHRVVKEGTTLDGRKSLSLHCKTVEVVYDDHGVFSAGPRSQGHKNWAYAQALALKLNQENVG